MQLGTKHIFKMAAVGKMYPNFSLLEMDLLTDLVSEEVSLSILQQEADVEANARKAFLWQTLAARLNAVYGRGRNIHHSIIVDNCSYISLYHSGIQCCLIPRLL